MSSYLNLNKDSQILSPFRNIIIRKNYNYKKYFNTAMKNLLHILAFPLDIFAVFYLTLYIFLKNALVSSLRIRKTPNVKRHLDKRSRKAIFHSRDTGFFILT